MISLELCEISFFLKKSRPQLQNSSYQRALSHKKILSLKQCSLTGFLNFKNVGL